MLSNNKIESGYIMGDGILLYDEDYILILCIVQDLRKERG